MAIKRKKLLFKTYLEKLIDVINTGDAREESFYSSLANLIHEVAHENGRPEIKVTILPRPTEAGNPDFRIWDGTSHIVGYIEAKPPTEEFLDRVEDSEQLNRYRGTFPNLILTNFLEFRLYRHGRCVATAQLGRPMILTVLHHIPPLEHGDEVRELLDQFLDFSIPRALNAENLAVELAKRTRFLREVLNQEFALEQATGKGHLLGFYEAFQKFLIGSLTPEEFADLYAQTVTYGLFAARTRATNGFLRLTAFHYIPNTIGILHDLFRFLSLEDLPEEIAWIIDDIVQVLAVVDVSEMMSKYYREGKGDDPIVHFYETFLAYYDPEERERRGVYYTPDPVVSYIVRSLDILLKTHFGKADGLAAEGTTLLDPAAGTMTFIARAAELAVREFVDKYGAGGREEFIRKHILGNYFAFELMMAPYTVGHLKMAFFLDELGHRLQANERVQFYLTNTLDMQELEASKLPGLSSLAEESHLAGRVKREQPILVILGNPPYSGQSTNQGEWILRQIATYKQVDGRPLGEKNPKWLQDDYVKFIRFAQWKVEQTGRGAVGMITNHGYLDNPTFRGMRQSLLKTFDEIYIIDLHGNTGKRECCPDGSLDENVFDIRQGVSIALLVKTDDRGGKHIYHADLWGIRENKYGWLNQHDINTTSWDEIHPKSEFYLFVPSEEAELDHYNSFPKVTDIFEKYSVGIVTARDKLTIKWVPEEVWTTVLNFSSMDTELARQAYKLGKDVVDWKVKLAQNDIRDSGLDRDKVVPIIYRPFDVRYTYYTGRSRGFHCRPRPEVMSNMIARENIALITARSNKSHDMDHFFVTDKISEAKCGESTTQSAIFPLYLYLDKEYVDLFSALEPQEFRPNLRPQILPALTDAYSQSTMPEQVFYYIYGVLYATSYRDKYADFLRLDFPRIPFTNDSALFTEMANLGEKLTALHLLHSSDLDKPICRFEGKGNMHVEKLSYDSHGSRLQINSTQYFAPIPLAVWEYTIGGYQVCEKWLKDRKNRLLDLDEIKTYCRIVTALAYTIELEEQINEIYSRIEQSLLLLKV